MKPSKRSQLLAWIKSRPYVTSYQVKDYAQNVLKLYDAYRRCAEWVNEGILVSLTAEEKKAHKIDVKYAAWRAA